MTDKRRRTVAICVTLTALAVLGISAMSPSGVLEAPASAQPGPAKPNILLIVTDDQRTGTLNVMAKVRSRFPTRFSNYFVTTDLCCPSRATYLTGQYAHNHGILTNQDLAVFEAREGDSLGPWLQASGYVTGFVGKYFNHFEAGHGIPPGWDEFHAIQWAAGGGKATDNCTTLTMRHKDRDRDESVLYEDVYCTDLFADLAETFVDHASDPTHNPLSKPWALLVWPNAPNFHTPPDRYASAPLPPWKRPPSFLEKDMSDKPAEIRRSPRRQDSAARHGRTRAGQLRSLMAVDDLVGRVFDRISAVGAADSTWGFFTSDNGRFWGEHRLSGKLYGYEEGVHVPLRMTIPDSVGGGFDELVGNIDVVPTLLDLAGYAGDPEVDGRSLLPLLDGTAAGWRGAMLEENWATARYDGIRTGRWRYLFWPESGARELYDRAADPWELRNIAAEQRNVAMRLHDRMLRLAQS